MQETSRSITSSPTDKKQTSSTNTPIPLQLGFEVLWPSQRIATQQLWNQVQGEEDAPGDFKALVAKSKIDIQDPVTGMTPLLFAIQKGYIKSVEMLLEVRVDPNVPNKKGMTPLLLAVEKGHVEIARLLLKNKATDPNVADKEKMTPLMHASRGDNQEMVDVFLDPKWRKRINFDLMNKDNNTAFMLAAKNKVSGIFKAFRLVFSLDSSKLKTVIPPLLDSGDCERLSELPIDLIKSTRVGGENGEFPVVVAAQKGHPKMVEFLITKGAWLGIIGRITSKTALTEAAKRGHLEVVRVLLNHNDLFIENAGGCYFRTTYVEGEYSEVPTPKDLLETDYPIVFSWNKRASENSWGPSVAWGVAEVSGGEILITDFPRQYRYALTNDLRWVTEAISDGLKKKYPNEKNLIHDVQGEFLALQAAVRAGHMNVVKELWEDKNRHKYLPHEVVYNAAISGQGDVLDYLLAAQPGGIDYPCHLLDGKRVSHLVKACRNGEYIGVQFLISRGAKPVPLHDKSTFPSKNKTEVCRSVELMEEIARKDVGAINVVFQEAKLTINFEHIKYAIKTIEKPEIPDAKFYSSLDKTLIYLMDRCWKPTDRVGEAYASRLKWISDELEKNNILLEKLPQVSQRINPPVNTSDSKEGAFVAQIRQDDKAMYPALPSAPRSEGQPQPKPAHTLPKSSSSTTTSSSISSSENTTSTDSDEAPLGWMDRFRMNSDDIKAAQKLLKVVQGDKDAPEGFRELVKPSVINVQDAEKSGTPLLLAVKNGHINSAKILLEAGADPNLADKHGMTPLMYASMQSNPKMVEIFFDEKWRKKIKLGLTNEKGDNACTLAAKNKVPEIYDALFPLFSSDTLVKKSLIPPLVNSGNCKRLGDLRLKLSDEEISGEPLLITAARKGDDKMVKFLIDQGVRDGIVGGDQIQTTALIEAAENGHLNVVQVLLKNNHLFVENAGGCYLNSMNNNPMNSSGTIIHNEISNNVLGLNVIRAVGPIVFNAALKTGVYYGAFHNVFGVSRVSSDDKTSTTQLNYQSDKRFSGGLAWIDKEIYAQLKKECESEENLIHDVQGEFFALEAAVKFGSTEIVKTLLKHNPWLKNYQNLGQIPLVQLAVENGHLDILRELWDRSIASYDMHKLQILAAQTGNIEIVKFLYQSFGSATYGALYYAAIHGSGEMLDYYLSKAAAGTLDTAWYYMNGKEVNSLVRAFVEGEPIGVQRLIFRGAKLDALSGAADPSKHRDATQQSVTLMRGIAERNETLIDGAIRIGKLDINFMHIEYAIKKFLELKKPDDESYSSLDITLSCLTEHRWGANPPRNSSYINWLTMISGELKGKDIPVEKLPNFSQKLNPPIRTPDKKEEVPFIAEPAVLEEKSGPMPYSLQFPVPQVIQLDPKASISEGKREIVSSAQLLLQVGEELEPGEQKKSRPFLLLQAVQQNNADAVRNVMNEEGVPESQKVQWRRQPEYKQALQWAKTENYTEIVGLLDLVPQLPVQLSELPGLRVVGAEAATRKQHLRDEAVKSGSQPLRRGSH